METALIVAIVGVGGTVLTAIVGVGGTLLVQRATDRREAKRLQRERELKETELEHTHKLKQLELEHEKQGKRREERILAYRNFFSAIGRGTTISTELRVLDRSKQIEAAMSSAAQLSAGMIEMYLVAQPTVLLAANALYKAVVDLDEDPSDEELGRIQELRGNFIVAARNDLGVSPKDPGVAV